MDFWKKSGQKKILKKIWLLVEELKLHPQTGTGQVEQLRGNLSGFWSSRSYTASLQIRIPEPYKTGQHHTVGYASLQSPTEKGMIYSPPAEDCAALTLRSIQKARLYHIESNNIKAHKHYPLSYISAGVGGSTPLSNSQCWALWEHSPEL